MNRRPEHRTKKLDYICVEYYRVHGTYYRSMVMGGKAGREGQSLVRAVRCLSEHNKLAEGCKLLLILESL